MHSLRAIDKRGEVSPVRSAMAGQAGPAVRAVIVGNGPSVDAIEREFWSVCRAGDVMLIGTNRVLCFAALQDAAWDALVIRDTYRNLWHEQEWGIRYHQELWKPCPCWKVGPADRRVTDCHEFVRQEPGWQFERSVDANGEMAVMRNSSVVVMAANWAFLMGVRDILLVGVDYLSGQAEMIEPYCRHAVGWLGRYEKAVPDSVERQFARAVEAVQSAGGRLLNLSPLTRLRAVPRCDWKELT